VAYGLIALFLAGCGLYFFVIYDFFGANEATVRPLVRQMPLFLAVLVPILTMRSVADEKHNGTMNWLQTLPVTDMQIIIGKFIASACIIFGILFTSGLFPALVAQVGSLDGGQILASYVGLFLVGCAYASLGILASALTSKPFFALVLGLFFGLVCYGTSFALGFVSPDLAELFSYVSFKEHFQTMERGVLDTRNLFFYGSVIFVALVFAAVALGRGRSSSKLISPLVLSFTLVFAVAWNLAASNLVGRIDLTKNSVNTLSVPSLEVVSKFAGLSVNLYVSPDIPDVIHDPVTGEPRNVRVAKQHVLDLLEEFRANAKGRMWVNTFTDDLDKEAEKAGMQPLYDRGREDTYYFGATFKFGDVVERLPSLLQAEFHEFDVTTTLVNLRKRAIGFKKIQDVRNAAKTVNKATLRCRTEMLRSVTPLDQLPAAKRQEPLLSRVRISDYKRRFRNIKDRCHWLGEVSKTISVYAKQNPILERMQLASIESADILRTFERALTKKNSTRYAPLKLAKQFIRSLEHLKNLHIDFEASPGRKSIGFVCSGTSFCPFRTAPRFTQEELDWLSSAPKELNTIGTQFVELSQKINERLEDIEQHFFRNYGIDIVHVDLAKPIPKGLKALVVMSSVGRSPAFKSSENQALHKFSEAELHKLDQFLLNDGSLAVFLNPWHLSLDARNIDGSTSSRLQANKSNIGKLLSHYGVTDTGKFIVEPRQHGQLKMKYTLANQTGNTEVDNIGYPLLPTLTTFNEKHPVARGTAYVTLPYATVLKLSHPKAQPLLLSSRKAVEAEAGSIPLDPQKLWEWSQSRSTASHEPSPVAATLEGRLDSYFKKAPPGGPEGKTKKQHILRGQGKLLVVGSNLGFEPLHHDTIFGPDIKLTNISKDPERHKYLLKNALMRFANWTNAMDRLEPVLGPSWTGTTRFFRNSLDWLVQDKEMNNVDIKLLPTATLDINPHNDRGWPARIRGIAIGAGPALLLFVGLLVFLTKRRRRQWIVGAVKKAKKPVKKPVPLPPKDDSSVDEEKSDGDPSTPEKDQEASPENIEEDVSKETDESIPPPPPSEANTEGKKSLDSEAKKQVKLGDTDENPQIEATASGARDTDENPKVEPSEQSASTDDVDAGA